MTLYRCKNGDNNLPPPAKNPGHKCVENAAIGYIEFLYRTINCGRHTESLQYSKTIVFIISRRRLRKKL